MGSTLMHSRPTPGFCIAHIDFSTLSACTAWRNCTTVTVQNKRKKDADKVNNVISKHGGPVAELLRTLIFSALNRSSSHRCGLEPSSGHMWDKPSSACRWSGGFSRGSTVFDPPYD